MAFEAARDGEKPALLDTIDEALEYVEGSPIGKDLVRPWIRDTSHPEILGSFVMIGGRMVQRHTLQ